MTLTHHTLLDGHDVGALAGQLYTAHEQTAVSIDTETSGLELFSGDYITGISVTLSEPLRWHDGMDLTGYYIPVAHKGANAPAPAVKALIDALETTAATHIFWHGTFDWHALTQLGFRPQFDRTLDAQVWRWLQDENAVKKLKVCGEMYLGEDASTEQRELARAMKSPWENQTQAYKAVREAYPELPVKMAREMARRMRAHRSWGDLYASEIGPYGARDATMTTQLTETLGLNPLSPSAAMKREQALQPILYEMTQRGVTVDTDALEAAGKLYRARAEAVRAELSDEFGCLFEGEFNPGSGPQTAEMLYGSLRLPVLGRTEGGAPSTDKLTLEQLQGHPVVAKIMEYRHWQKAVSAYTDPWLAFAAHDGRIHGQYDSNGTVTGRLKATMPNVMTIPKEDTLPELRACFYAAPPGLERVSFDLVSAELWVTASITQDPVLEAILLEGRDMHAETAMRVFGNDQGRWRTLAKNCNYGVLYEAGVDQLASFAAKCGFGPKEARKLAFDFRDGHRRMFRQQHAVSDWLANQADQLGRLPLHVNGRYRHFKSPGVYVQTYTALNALVQGGVAEFMKDVMLNLNALRRSQLILQVHDELVFDVEPGDGVNVLAELRAIAADINPFKYCLQWDTKAWSKC